MTAGTHPRAARLPDALVERDAELALLAALVERTRGQETSVALVVGPPGSGRTALLARAARTAELDGVRVLAATGTVTEAGLRFGVVSQLLTRGGADLPPGVGEVLWDPAVPDEVAVPVLCRHFLSRGREAPLLVVIDDVHLVDPHTRLWTQAMARRLAGTPLTMLLSSTSSLAQVPATVASGPHDPHGPLGREPHHLLRLDPLSREGVAGVVGARLGERVAGLADELFTATAGNPAVLNGVLARLGESGVRGTVDVLAVVADERRSRTTAALGQLSREVLSLLGVVVVAGRVLPVDVLSSLADLGSTPLSHAVRLLCDVALVSPRGDRLVADDVVTTCVLATMSAADREDLHARAADLAHRSLVPDADMATLLLGAGPVGASWAADVLCAAAHSTRSSSPHGTAVRFLRRALAEPLSGARRAQVLVELAAIEAVDHPEAGDLRLTQVLLGDDSAETAPARLAAADIMLASGSTALVRQLLASVRSRQDAARPESSAMSSLHWLAEESSQGERDMALPVEHTRPHSGEDPDRAGVVSWLTAARGRDADGARRLARIALSQTGGDSLLAPRMEAARTLAITDDVVEAMAGLEGVLIDARRRGARSVESVALVAKAQLNLQRGRPYEAAEDLCFALTSMPLRQWRPAALPMAVGCEILLAVDQGRFDVAETAAATSMPAGAEQSIGWPYLLFAQGVLHLSAGRFELALQYLLECGRRLMFRKWFNPAVMPWRSLAALAHRACGREHDANRLFAEEWRLAEGWGTHSVLGVVSLWEGQTTDDGDLAHAKLTLAVQQLRLSPARSWYAHALYALAANQAASGDEHGAAVLLADCERLATVQTAGRLRGDVRVLADRLRAERRLAIVGGTRLDLPEIAARITELVVREVSTRDIALALSVSQRTVEQHLTRIYRTFGVTGRTELRSVLARGGEVPRR